MFDDYSRYPKERVKLFLSYLANAASRHGRMPVSTVSRPVSRQGTASSFIVKEHEREIQEYREDIEKRLDIMSEDRRDELEAKIKVFYTKNKYMPFHIKLEKLKKRYRRMKSSKRYSKEKIDSVKNKIEKCQKLLKKIEKLDVSGH